MRMPLSIAPLSLSRRERRKSPLLCHRQAMHPVPLPKQAGKTEEHQRELYMRTMFEGRVQFESLPKSSY